MDEQQHLYKFGAVFFAPPEKVLDAHLIVAEVVDLQDEETGEEMSTVRQTAIPLEGMIVAGDSVEQVKKKSYEIVDKQIDWIVGQMRQDNQQKLEELCNHEEQ